MYAQQICDFSAKNKAQQPLKFRSAHKRSIITSHVRKTVVYAQKQQYDYIIVGAGASGCLLANRLSQDLSKQVLLLEAGPNASGELSVKIPAGLTRLFKSNLDWNMYSTIQKQLNEREVYLARGKMLGGSTGSNALLYHRGTAQDYDDWKLENWASKDVRDWFKKNEDNAVFGDSEYHGKGGEYKIESPRYYNKLHDAFFQACQGLGLKRKEDFNNWSQSQVGYGDFQMTTTNGERGHNYRNFLQSIVDDRPNLTIKSGAQATKILTESYSNNRNVAKGIEYTMLENFGPRFNAECKSSGEVIVTSGAIHSPYLLQHSGIGPANLLQEHDIKVVADIAGVGKNLQDHPACITAFKFRDDAGQKSVLDDLMNGKGGVKRSAILNYVLRRRGPLASVGCERGAFLDLKGTGRADVQLRFVPGFSLDSDGVSTYYLVGKANQKQEKIPVGVTFQVIACKAKSTGQVGLKSNSPLDKPNIDIGYLNNSDDLETIINGLKYTREIAKQPSLGNLIESEGWPGSAIQTNSQWAEYVHGSIHSSNALVGTCKMGVQDDPSSVVLPDLKVKGVDNLRVIDSSVLPIIPAGQTGAPTIMVAERAASIIKEQARGTSGATFKAPELVGV